MPKLTTSDNSCETSQKEVSEICALLTSAMASEGTGRQAAPARTWPAAPKVGGEHATSPLCTFARDKCLSVRINVGATLHALPHSSRHTGVRREAGPTAQSLHEVAARAADMPKASGRGAAGRAAQRRCAACRSDHIHDTKHDCTTQWLCFPHATRRFSSSSCNLDLRAVRSSCGMVLRDAAIHRNLARSSLRVCDVLYTS